MSTFQDSNIASADIVEGLKNIVIDTCAYYRQNPAKVQLLFNGRMPAVQFDRNGTTEKGMRNILHALKLDYGGSDGGTAAKCAVEDWAEFCLTKLAHGPQRPDYQHILNEMNNIVEDKVHLVGSSATAADVLVYFFLYDLMVALSFREKEKYVHVCRWFDNIQQDSRLRTRQRQLVSFSKARIYA